MFENIEIGDTVLVSVTGKRVSMFQVAKRFRVTIKVTRTTKKQFVTEDGRKWRKDNGASIPAGGTCIPYKEADDETEDLKAYNDLVSVICAINDKLHQVGTIRTNVSTPNPHAINEQLNILIKMLGDGKDER